MNTGKNRIAEWVIGHPSHYNELYILNNSILSPDLHLCHINSIGLNHFLSRLSKSLPAKMSHMTNKNKWMRKAPHKPENSYKYYSLMSPKILSYLIFIVCTTSMWNRNRKLGRYSLTVSLKYFFHNLHVLWKTKFNDIEVFPHEFARKWLFLYFVRST